MSSLLNKNKGSTLKLNTYSIQTYLLQIKKLLQQYAISVVFAEFDEKSKQN